MVISGLFGNSFHGNGCKVTFEFSTKVGGFIVIGMFHPYLFGNIEIEVQD